jgi:homocysteine S-methyltransferase
MARKPPIHLLDGGLGTLLADQYNAKFDESTPLWSSQLLLSSSGQKTLLDAQSTFANAGADIVLSATYQASFTGSVSSGISNQEEASKLMRDGVSIARASFKVTEREGRGKVALSLGAYGATMIPGAEYSGAYDNEHRSVEQLKEWHLTRLRVFGPEEENEKRECWENVDFVAFETLPRIEEVRAVREVMSSLPNGKERGFWISCVFPGEGNKLPDGSSVREVVGAMIGGEGKRPLGIGINCTKVGKVEGLVMEFEDAVREVGGERLALVLYPDGTRGEVYNTTTKEWEKVEGMEESKVS